MTTVASVCLVVLAVAAIGCTFHLARSRSVADRIVALDLLLIVIVVGIAVDAARTGEGTYLDLLVVFALVAFIGTVSAARFLEQRGQA